MVPHKISISDLMGRVKTQTAIKIFKQFPHLKQRPYWGDRFWSKSYCVDTVRPDEETIHNYVKYQEEKERYFDQLKFGIK